MTNTRLLLSVAGSLILLLAAAVLLWSAVATSSAQINASTSSEGVFSAGTIALDRAGTTIGLLFDADDVVPGHVENGCVTIGYSGSLPATIRLHARPSGGTGLEEYIELRLWPIDGDVCPETAPDEAPLYVGRLDAFWMTHPDYGRGLDLVDPAQDGDVVTLLAEAELVGGNEAQGLSSDFTFVAEARP